MVAGRRNNFSKIQKVTSYIRYKWICLWCFWSSKNDGSHRPVRFIIKTTIPPMARGGNMMYWECFSSQGTGRARPRGRRPPSLSQVTGNGSSSTTMTQNIDGRGNKDTSDLCCHQVLSQILILHANIYITCVCFCLLKWKIVHFFASGQTHHQRRISSAVYWHSVSLLLTLVSLCRLAVIGPSPSCPRAR